jgi:hypothetical protein
MLIPSRNKNHRRVPMPLNIQVKRKGKPVRGLKWDYAMLSVCMTVVHIEQEPTREFNEGRTYADLKPGQFVDWSMAPIYYMESETDLFKKGAQTLKQDHSFDLTMEMPDGSIQPRKVNLKKGDVISMYRSYK